MPLAPSLTEKGCTMSCALWTSDRRLAVENHHSVLLIR